MGGLVTLGMKRSRHEAHNTTEYVLEPQDDSTKLTWAMFGSDFEAGLVKLKAAAEK